jgi:hypothetical protein
MSGQALWRFANCPAQHTVGWWVSFFAGGVLAVQPGDQQLRRLRIF